MRPTLSPTSRRAPLAALVVLAGLTCVIYWPALYGPFLLDDGSNIPQTRLDTFSLPGLLDVALGNSSGPFGRPLAVASFALNYLLGDGSPFGFKLVNLLIHCLNAALVYLFCHAALHACARAGDVEPTDATVRLAALLAAALWTLHPLQVSTVMYAVQRMALLATTFSLAALTLYLRMRIGQRERGHARAHEVPMIVLCTLLACLSKENGALILLHILLLEALLFGFGASTDGRRIRFIASFGALVCLPVLVALVYVVVRPEVVLSGYALREFDLEERLWTQTTAMVGYLGMILLPRLTEMTFYHDGLAVVRELDARVLRHAAIVLCACALVPVLARRARPLSVGLGLFLVSHAMESTVLPLELAFEHRNYFGIVGFALPLAWYAVGARPAGGARTVPIALAAAALLALSALTHARALEWSSDLALHAFAAENAPESLRARTNLAISLAREGHHERAFEVLETASERWPRDAFVPLLIVEQQTRLGILDPARLESAERGLRRGTLDEYVASLLARMRVEQRSGRVDVLDPVRLEALFSAALSAGQSRLRRINEAMLHVLHAELLDETGHPGAALDALGRAHALAPESRETRLRLAESLASTGELERARGLLLALEASLSTEEYESSERIRALVERVRPDETAVIDEDRL